MEQDHTHKSKKGYDRIQQALDRRNIIKKIMKERGFKSVLELTKILESEYNIHVTRKTVYGDLENIDALTDDDIRPFRNKIVSECRLHLNELNKIARRTKNEHTRIKAIKAYFAAAKDMAYMISMLSPHVEKPKQDGKPQVEEDEKITIRFDEDG